MIQTRGNQMYPANGLGVSGAEGTDVHAHSCSSAI
jgi:hypothetical protein